MYIVIGIKFGIYFVF